MLRNKKLKTLFRNIAPLFFCCAVLFVLAGPALAQTSYTLLAPLPTSDSNLNNPPTTSTAGNYLVSIFKLGIGIAGALAVLVIAFNGLRYMISDVVTNKSAAVSGIKNALFGLVLALGSWVILNQISDQFTTGLHFGEGVASINIQQQNNDIRCPGGSLPNADGTGCNLPANNGSCPDGYVLNAAGDDCVLPAQGGSCPEGYHLNAAGDDCILNPTGGRAAVQAIFDRITAAETDVALLYLERADFDDQRIDILIAEQQSLGGANCEDRPPPAAPVSPETGCQDQRRYLEAKAETERLIAESSRLRAVGDELDEIYIAERAALGAYEANPTDAVYNTSRSELQAIITQKQQITVNADISQSDKDMIIAKAQATLADLDALKAAIGN